MPRRWPPGALLAITTMTASGCATRDDQAYRARERRHPTLAVVIDGSETTAYVVLDLTLRAAALALSR